MGVWGDRSALTGNKRALYYQYQAIWTQIANCSLVPAVLRGPLLRRIGVVCAGPTEISSGVRISGPGEVRLGAGVFVNVDCYFDCVADITVGDRVFIGDHVRILTSSHEIGDERRRAGALTGAPVVVGDGTWIGSGVVVMPGVRIGEGCIIGARSLVTKDCEPNGLYLGSPARRVRDLP